MKLIILSVSFFFVFNALNAQMDSLATYSLTQLDSLYKVKKKPQEQLPYALALLQKGEKELDTKDTSYAKLLFNVGNTYQKLRDWSNATNYLEQSIAIWQLKMPIHTEYANCLYSLGIVYYYQKKNEKTEKYWLQGIDIRKKTLGDKHSLYLKSLNNLAVLYREMDKDILAEELYQEVLKIRKEVLGDKHADYAQSLNNLAVLYREMNKDTLAEEFCQEALQIRKEVLGDKHPDYVQSLNNLAILYRKMGNYSLVEPLYQEVLKIRKEVLGDKHPDYAQSLMNLGFLYDIIGNYVLAESLYQEALKIRKEVLGSKHSEYTQSLNHLGNLYLKVGNYALAESLYKEALKIRKEVLGSKHSDYASSVYNLGLLYLRMGNYTLAEPQYQEALKIKKEILGDKHPDYAEILNSLAGLYREMGNYSLAKSLHQEALKIRKEVLGNKHPDYALSLLNLGGVYKKTNNYALADSLYQESLKIQREVLGNMHPEYATSLNNLGLLYNDMGNYGLAEPLFQEALKIRKEVLGDKHPDYANNLMNLALLYDYMSNYSLAEFHYQEALKILKEVLGYKHPYYANNLTNLGNLYWKMGKNALAEPLYQEALQIRKEVLGDKHPLYAHSLNNLGNLYWKMGNYALAEPLYQEALKTIKEALGNKNPDYAEILNNLALLYKAMGKNSKADSCYSQCLDTKNMNLSTNFSWLPEKGKTAYWQKERSFYQELNNYAAQATTTFPQAAVLAYNSNLIAKGLLLESAKEVEYAVGASKDSTTLQVYEDLKKKKRLINHLVSSGTGKKEILDLYENEVDSLDKILVGCLGEYAAFKKKFQITWKEVQGALVDNEMAIEFARFYNEKDSQHYYMALLLRKGYELPKLVKLGSEKAISAIPAAKGFAELYKLIWEPIDSFLNGVETVYYSPDGVLNNIAFAALCSKGTEKVTNTKEIKRGSVGKTGGTEMENCTYLSERYTLHQVSITRYLAEGLKNSKMDNSMLVFGGVNYDEIPATGDTIAEVQVVDFEDYALAENISRSSTNQSRMEYLPGTQTELQNVQKIMNRKKWNIRAFSDKNASENTLKTEIQKESPNVLHIATHGFAFPDATEKKSDSKTYRDADNPMARCGLLFAGANHSWTGDSKTVLAQTGEDGILTALEVSNLPLKNTKLVVLSACETGLGKIQGTEGVFGLKRGFKLALVEQIIVSLWSVPDKETMELMDIFYNDLAKTRNAVVSFEKAQKEMRKKYADRPDLWAGFVLVR